VEVCGLARDKLSRWGECACAQALRGRRLISMYSEGIVQLPITKWFDVRPGEGKLVAAASGVLFTTIAGHTLLETARDALFLQELEPSRLTLVYGALALLAVLAARGSTALCRAQGERRALGYSLILGLLGAIAFYLAPKTEVLVFSLYLWTGVLTGVAVAQFWMLAARVFTIAQAKRLLGPIASAGILGGVAGGASAVLLLRVLQTRELLPVAAACFAVALVPLRFVPSDAEPQQAEPGEVGQGELSVGAAGPSALAEQKRSEGAEVPADRRYLRLVTLLVAVATMTLLCIDYVFKASAARALPSADLGAFFARYYAVLNLVAFAFQLVLATLLLRRLGVLASVAVLPLLLILGSLMTFAIGPALGVVLLVKGADGSLRHSLHRTSTELLWMPLSPETRGDAKPLVDTFVVRVAQALAAGGVFGLAWWRLDTPQVLSAVVAALAFVWVVLTLLLRHPYLELFRQALERDRELEGPLPLSLASLEVLLQALSSLNPSRATAAIHVLASHDRARLIPALTLFHPDPEVLLAALKYVPAADRSDWVAPTERLIDHASEEVRVAAMGVLAEHGIHAPLERRLMGDDPVTRGHAVVLLAERSQTPPHRHASVRALFAASGPDAVKEQVALLRAVRGHAAWGELCRGLLGNESLGKEGAAAESPEAAAVAEAAVDCAATVRDPRLIEPLLRRLAVRKQRDRVREALVLQGPEALETAAAWLADADTPPRIRRHLPRTISRFACQRAADILAELLASEPEGAIRYKALRGLGRLAREAPIELDGHFLERLLRDNLGEGLRMHSIHFVIQLELSARADAEPSAQLLLQLLLDKAEQATERAFRILGLLHPKEDVRSIAEAVMSGDKASHARALEYLSTLALDLESKTGELLRLVVDNLEASVRVELARAELDAIPDTASVALDRLTESGDEALESVVRYYRERRQARALAPPAPASQPGAASVDSRSTSAPRARGREHVERSG